MSAAASLLLERAAPLAALGEQLGAVRARREGRLLLLSGEAGVGKTVLLRAFCADAAPARVLWGACDALRTPRALGPLVDVAETTGGELEAVVGAGAAPGAVAAALAAALRAHAEPAIVVLEDLHWADGATLDVLRLLARRVASVPALVIATYRDELDRTHPLRVALGELPAGPATARLALAPLSPGAVAELAASAAVDPAALHRATAGNPFFVSEVLAAGGATIPDTVRDAVLARAARLEDRARTLLDAVAIEPARAELWLLAALVDGEPSGLDACVAAGMLRVEGNAVSFRHEIARAAIADALPPARRMLLHRRALGALTAAIGRRPDLARLAHHAEAADDAATVLRYAPAAGERAAALGSHGAAAEQFARAARYAGALSAAERAALLERAAYECYLTDRIPEAIAARRAALAEHRAAGDRRREGDARRWLSRLSWFAGDNAAAEEEARRAIALLEPLRPAGPELAMAYSNMAQLRMLASDEPEAVAWGLRAIALAEELREPEILVHALNNVGAAQLRLGAAEGAARLERSLALALEHDFEEHVARAYTNLGAAAVEQRDTAEAARRLDAGIAYCAERDLTSWSLYMTGYRARLELDIGRWDAAAASAEAVLGHPRVAAPTRLTPLVVLGVLRARRGEPDPWTPLDEALALARGTGELQRLGFVAAARAEARWAEGQDAEVASETAAALALALARRDPWIAGELLAWRRRAGIADDEAGADADAGASAGASRARGCAYAAALAEADTGAEPALRRALAGLQALGARPAAERVARALRSGGAREVPAGPRPATRENPAGLTARELDVLALLAEGLRNGEIAARLFVSERTAAHHVSAILRKLGVATRGQAAVEGLRRGIVGR